MGFYLFRVWGEFSLLEFFLLSEGQGGRGVGDEAALSPMRELVPKGEGVVVGVESGAAGE
jgi:hypothetical protein